MKCIQRLITNVYVHLCFTYLYLSDQIWRSWRPACLFIVLSCVFCFPALLCFVVLCSVNAESVYDVDCVCIYMDNSIYIRFHWEDCSIFTYAIESPLYRQMLFCMKGCFIDGEPKAARRFNQTDTWKCRRRQRSLWAPVKWEYQKSPGTGKRNQKLSIKICAHLNRKWFLSQCEVHNNAYNKLELKVLLITFMRMNI